mmetsp:Transcript_10390/g.13150  ORF Transcript_10390/g.13150 Transcript_10390/m.13150 type:complete len:135 (-) Transcript_10390:413-817(-)
MSIDLDTCAKTLLSEATMNHHKARQYIQQKRYNEALDLLKHTLKLRKKYQHKPPFVCVIDIATVQIDIGNVLRLLALYSEATMYFYQAFTNYSNYFGSDHHLTQNVRDQCILTRYEAGSYKMIKVGCSNTAPAA